MKKRLMIFISLLVIGVLLGGMPVLAAPGAPGYDVVKLTQAHQGQRVVLRGDVVLSISLEANPSTGYAWYAEGNNAGILKQRGESSFSEIAGPLKLGASQTQVLEFVGVARGAQALTLVYKRPWETAAPLNTFSVDVSVARPASAALAQPVLEDEPDAQVGVESTLALPTSWNWCSLNGCTPVRNQGACGSCWAFGTVGSFESAILLKDSESKDLSEQYLVSCNMEGWGCSGGWWAHDYHQWKYIAAEPGPGAVYETAFPYVASDVPCNSPYDHNEKIVEWHFIGSDSAVPPVADIKQAIYDHGPVSVAVCVNTAFQSYTGGVFNSTRPPCRSINHAVVLVGWNDADGAWIMRNSWGPNWGEAGYMRIAYGANQIGYSANYVVYGATEPTPTPTETPTETPVPPGTMSVSAITMWYSRTGSYYYTVYTKVAVVDEFGVAVPAATVSLRLTTPSGSSTSSSGATGADGTVTFSLRSRTTGTYVSEVTNVTHAALTYNPAANLETFDSLPVP